MEKEYDELLRPTLQYLQGLQRAGLTDLPSQPETPLGALDEFLGSAVVSEEKASFSRNDEAPSVGPVTSPASGSAMPSNPSPSPSPQPLPLEDPYGAKLGVEQRDAQLNLLAQQVSRCQRCSELSSCRTNTVFGVGNRQPRLAFFGEGPGADEDRLGEPFVGRAGQLLNKIIAACKMNREDVYIFNSVKCRPPGNRNPREEEISNCWEYAEKQLEILQPEYICCLGSVAARTLLRTTESVGRLRGSFHQYRGSRVVVTYHPAYLLRAPEAKSKTWDDMKMLMDAMGIEY